MSCQPLITGCMYSVSPNSFNDGSFLFDLDATAWQGEFDAMQRFGLDLLCCWQGVEDALNRRAAVGNGDLLDFLFAETERRGMQISLSVGFRPGWWETWQLEETVDFARRNIDTLFARYGGYRSFGSWYLDYEIYLRFGREAELMAELYRRLTGHAHEVSGKPVVVSPFFMPDTQDACGAFDWRPPEVYYHFWRDLLACSRIDILALQDNGGQHLSSFSEAERRSYIEPVIRACRETGTRYWGNVESGELPVAGVDDFVERFGRGSDVNALWIRPYWRGVPLEKLRGKLELAARDAERIMSWGYQEFFRPSGGAENRRRYEEYLVYRDAVAAGKELQLV